MATAQRARNVVQHNLHNTVAGGGLYNFRPEILSKLLIIINFRALQPNGARRQFATRGEALAPGPRGEEHCAGRPCRGTELLRCKTAARGRKLETWQRPNPTGW